MLLQTHDGEPQKKKAKKSQSKKEQRLAEKKAKVKKEKAEEQFSHVDTPIGILTVKVFHVTILYIISTRYYVELLLCMGLL